MDKKFKPTRLMVRLLQAYLALEPNEVPTNTLLAMKAGINRNTIPKWNRKVAFQAWWDSQIQRYTSTRLSRIWGAMYQAGVKGDTPAAKLFAERFDKDYKPTTKREQELSFNKPKEINTGQRDAVALARRNILDGIGAKEN